MCKGRVTYPPVTTVTDATERRKGKATYPDVTPATEKGPADSTWHLKSLQERHFGDMGILSTSPPPTCTDWGGTAIALWQAHRHDTSDQRGLSMNPGLTYTGAHGPGCNREAT